MSALDELIREIQDDDLRGRIKEEFDKLRKRKKFGLVFESANEYTPLYNVPVKRNSLVAKKTGKFDEIYKVIALDGDKIFCVRDKENFTFARADLISVARFGDPIYPCLTKLDEVCNAPDSDLWHLLIEADNFHALQLLKYVCAPPYNTGASDWKYNNDYVDAADNFRHSKWLSMMERRLKLAKEILNPNDSVLIVTIDEKEYLHLGCLLEEIFRGARIQMISSVINPAGAGRQADFARTDEYIFFIQLGNSVVLPEARDLEDVPIVWDTLRRSNAKNTRDKTNKQFYPIYVNKQNGLIEEIGDPLPKEMPITDAPQKDGCIAVFPIRDNGVEMMWGCSSEELRQRLAEGFVRAGKFTPNKPQKCIISYVTSGVINDIKNGKAIVTGYNLDGSVIAHFPKGRDKMPTTNWNRATHDAQQYGTKILNAIIGGNRFSFPKSLYAVRDALKFFVANKPDALIVDFFAGSGTTLHAVNLLNAEDGGKRRCILVTNNEVSDAEEKNLRKQGFTPADDEWQRLGIARHVTWQRTVCSIEGHDVNGEPLKGNYLGSDLPMADGFKANAIFFKLNYLDKNDVALGKSFKELLAVMWLKAGGIGKCPSVEEIPPYLILPENKFAVLIDEKYFKEFAEALRGAEEVETVFIATGSKATLNKMRELLNVPRAVRLYGDYLKHFRAKEVKR